VETVLWVYILSGCDSYILLCSLIDDDSELQRGRLENFCQCGAGEMLAAGNLSVALV
jgi:hypothetical protein